MTRPFIASVLGGLAIVLYAYAWLAWSTPAHAATCGTASWYGAAHHGRLTASGQRFNMHALTAAMPDRKHLGERYRVTHGSKSVVVTINDVGPAKRLHRVIDLSMAAADRLGLIARGIGPVCLEKL